MSISNQLCCVRVEKFTDLSVTFVKSLLSTDSLHCYKSMFANDKNYSRLFLPWPLHGCTEWSKLFIDLMLFESLKKIEVTSFSCYQHVMVVRMWCQKNYSTFLSIFMYLDYLFYEAIAKISSKPCKELEITRINVT